MTTPTSTPSTATVAALEVRDLGKSYPGVRAVDAVTLRVESGEVLGLVGENGAGKSTIMKMIAGAASFAFANRSRTR